MFGNAFWIFIKNSLRGFFFFPDRYSLTPLCVIPVLSINSFWEPLHSLFITCANLSLNSIIKKISKNLFKSQKRYINLRIDTKDNIMNVENLSKVDLLKKRILDLKPLPKNHTAVFMYKFPEYDNRAGYIKYRNCISLRIADEDITEKLELLHSDKSK